MAVTINKQKLINHVLALGKKFDTEVGARPVLEEFVYGLCRESATPEQADRAYAYLQERFFDWNEVRVSSTRELEEAFEGLPDAEGRAERLIAFLQEVFETTYSFDLESMLKKGVKLAAKQLSRYQAHTEYVGAWVVQRSLGGHAIPVDTPTLRCAGRLALIEVSPGESSRSALEHLVPKAKGPLFTDILSRVADQYCFESAPHCPACPLRGDCPSAGTAGVGTNGSGARAHRPKPR